MLFHTTKFAAAEIRNMSEQIQTPQYTELKADLSKEHANKDCLLVSCRSTLFDPANQAHLIMQINTNKLK